MPESVFQYPGGKARIASWIADRLPPPGSFNVFVDVFGGSGSVLLEAMRRCEKAGKKTLFVLTTWTAESSTSSASCANRNSGRNSR